MYCPVGWGCRIHRLHLCRKVRAPGTECSGYDTKQSDDEVPVRLEFWGMRNTPALQSLQCQHLPKMEASNRILSMGRIKLNCILMQNLNFWNRTVFDIETVLTLNWIVLNRTVLTFNCVWTKTILILNWIVLIRIVWLNWIHWNRNVFAN